MLHLLHFTLKMLHYYLLQYQFISSHHVANMFLIQGNQGHKKLEKASAVPVEKKWQQIKEEITCSICGDLFTDPKTIPCLHTFCKQCIEKCIESNKKMESLICCPLCRAPLPQDDVSSLPTNFTINRLVEIFGKQKEAVKSLSLKEIECSSCENGLPAVTWCTKCKDSLCENCHDAHQTMRIFKSHKTIAVEEFIKNPKQILSTPENL